MSKSSVAKNASFRTYTKVSDEDWDWFVTQKPSVQQLWGECMRAERFGEKFYKLETKLSENVFYEAKKVLEGQLFEFQPIQKLTKNGRYKNTGWKVRNLHGSNIHEYWNTTASLVPQNSGEEMDATQFNSKRTPTTEVGVSYHENQGVLPRNSGEEKPVALDTTAFETSLLSTYNLLSSNESKKDSSSISRSGCSELAPCTKVAGSAPAPDAKLTREGNPEASLTDLPSSSSDLEHGLISEPGKREDDLPVQKMLDQCGELNTISAAPISPAEPALESPQTPPDPWDAQSDTPPVEPTLPPRIAPDKAECSRVYITVKQRLSEAGLLKGSWHKSLTRFQEELERGNLYSIVEGYKPQVGCDDDEVPQALLDDLVTDYLLHSGDSNEEPQVCVRRSSGGLTLIPWSKL